MFLPVFLVKDDHESISSGLIDFPVTFPDIVEKLEKVLLHQKIYLFIIQGFTHAAIPAMRGDKTLADLAQ